MKMHDLNVLGAAALMLTASAYAAGEGAAGQPKNAMCQGCHGIPGYKTAFPSVYNVPKLGGQHAGYIVKALQAYKSGERSHPTMQAIAAGLSDKDMADLAAYYSAVDAKTASK
jgi:cytochrome c553